MQTKVMFLLVCALLPFLVSADGFPSRPRFSSVGVGVAAPAGTGNLAATGTVTAATVNATGTVTAATVNATGTITAATVNATTALQLNGVAVPAESSGSESLTFSSGCTTTPAVSGTWRKMGTIVVLKIPSTTCTANNGVYTWGVLSAGIRPVNQQQITVSMSCSGTRVYSVLAVLSSGNIQAVTDSLQCAAGSLNTSGYNITYSTAL